MFQGENLLSVFQIINVRDRYSKNLTIHFNPVHFTEVLMSMKQHESLEEIISVVIFIFSAIITISADKNINRIKIHTHDEIMHIIFSKLADMHDKIHSVKKYGQWVDATLKPQS